MKQIKDYEDYSVDELGNVYSHKWGKVRELNQGNDRGYNMVNLYINGKKTPKTVHRLVALAFIPNPENKPQINHIDNDPSNNHKSNLEWVSHQENTQHRNNQNRQAKGSKNGRSVLTESDIPLIRQLLKDGVTQKEIAKRFCVSPQIISNIKNDKIWKHI